jgi:hypothetical protein
VVRSNDAFSHPAGCPAAYRTVAVSPPSCPPALSATVTTRAGGLASLASALNAATVSESARAPRAVTS